MRIKGLKIAAIALLANIAAMSVLPTMPAYAWKWDQPWKYDVTTVHPNAVDYFSNLGTVTETGSVGSLTYTLYSNNTIKFYSGSFTDNGELTSKSETSLSLVNQCVKEKGVKAVILDIALTEDINLTRLFCDCTNLEAVKFSDTMKATSGHITSTNYMFYNCSSFVTFGDKVCVVDMTDIDYSKVASMMHMYHGCTTMHILDYSGLDLSPCWDYFMMIEGCTNLHTFYTPNHLNVTETLYLPTMFRRIGTAVNDLGDEYGTLSDYLVSGGLTLINENNHIWTDWENYGDAHRRICQECGFIEEEPGNVSEDSETTDSETNEKWYTSRYITFDDDGNSTERTHEMVVHALVESDYAVQLPATLALTPMSGNALRYVGDFTVGAKGAVKKNEYIEIAAQGTPTDDGKVTFTMTGTKNSANMAQAKVGINGGSYARFGISDGVLAIGVTDYAKGKASISVDLPAADSYTGNLVFAFGLKSN